MRIYVRVKDRVIRVECGGNSGATPEQAVQVTDLQLVGIAAAAAIAELRDRAAGAVADEPTGRRYVTTDGMPVRPSEASERGGGWEEEGCRWSWVHPSLIVDPVADLSGVEDRGVGPEPISSAAQVVKDVAQAVHVRLSILVTYLVRTGRNEDAARALSVQGRILSLLSEVGK